MLSLVFPPTRIWVGESGYRSAVTGTPSLDLKHAIIICKLGLVPTLLEAFLFFFATERNPGMSLTSVMRKKCRYSYKEFL